MRSNACPGRVGNKNIDMDLYFFFTTSRMENKNIDIDVKIYIWICNFFSPPAGWETKERHPRVFPTPP